MKALLFYYIEFYNSYFFTENMFFFHMIFSNFKIQKTKSANHIQFWNACK